MSRRSELIFIDWRFKLVVSIVLFSALGLILRVFDLAILKQPFLTHEGNERTLRLVKKPSFRGMMVDRNGFPLAVSTPVFSVWMNPQQFSPGQKQKKALAAVLNLKSKDITTLLARYHNREFAYLKRGVAPEVADKIKALAFTGIYLQQSYRRFYPEGEVAAHVVGLTNIDDQGQEGMELAFNDWLAGIPGKAWVMKDRIGQIIADVETVTAQKPGQGLVLSIDKRIQYLAFRELQNGIKLTLAQTGSVVVLDTETGEILAMVNYPSFNPNQRPERIDERFRNRAVTDMFEPGSTIKPFSIAAALMTNKYTADTVINTSPGWLRVGHNIVRDENNNGPMTVRQIMQISSNVGVTKLILSTSAIKYWNLLHDVGFGEISGVGFPGEQPGILPRHYIWGDFMLATLAYGYGLSVNTLQLARAYAILANKGIKKPVSLLKIDTPPIGERVMDSKLAQSILDILESVSAKGATGYRARVVGYRIAGKTGTSIVAKAGGYGDQYIASFIGIAPVTHPKVIVAVVIKNPKQLNHQGGHVAAPIFQKIMAGTLRVLDIPPDG